jgi:hypothetical protein
MTAKSRILTTVAAGIACMAATSGAMATATFTTVSAPTVSGEKNHAQLLSQVYGGTWTTSNGLDYTNGSLTATRLADAGVSTPTSLTTGVSGTDDAWTGPAATSIVAQAKYAADNSMFGYFDDTGTDHSFHALFNTGSAGASAAVLLPSSFRWGLQDLSTGKLWTSRASDQSTPGLVFPIPSDQMVTYKVTGANGESVTNEWALFWEDRGAGQVSDRDFNDAVITIQASAIPAPGAAALLGLGTLCVARRKRPAQAK